MESKMLEFAQDESTRSWLSAENWLDRYIYTYIHEIIFAEFPIVLQECFSILVTRQTKFQRREVVEWSAQLIHELTGVSNPISRAIDFWVDNIFEGYITEFAVEMITS